MKDNYTVQVNATRHQIEEFKESILWSDICKELDFWTEGFNREEVSIVDKIATENLSTAATLTLVGSIDGRKKAVAYFKQILDVFLNILEEKENDTRRNETN